MTQRSAIRRTLFPALLGISIASYASSARSDEETAAARLFEEARALMVEGRFAEACSKLAESQRMEPRGGTQLNLAVCHERQGKIATAWVEFHDALITARTDGGHPDRESLALARIAVIEPRVPWLTVRLTGSGAPDVAVQIDGAAIAPIALGKEMPVDPGDHRVSASVGGRVVWDQTVSIAESQRTNLVIPIPAEASAPPLAEPSASPPPAPAEAMPAKDPPWKGRWVLEAGGFGGGLWGNLSKISSTRADASVPLHRLSGIGPENASCAVIACRFATLSQSSPLFGIRGFVGYAPRPYLRLGARLTTGITLSGNGLIALGPAVSARIVGPLWLGGSLLVGAAFGSAEATVTPQSNYEIVGGRPLTAVVPAWTGPSPGASIEIGVSLLEQPGGSLIAEAAPLFFASPLGRAFALPVGLAYRWH